ncbi:hypothetical protein JW926_01755 [Candidatus Sumerlaeota bacterium]|nr:hypothetical protein [Candidatus Sumerlaeota bacterium]
MKLNGKALGVAWGILWGGAIFLATLAVVFRGGSGELTGKLARFYIGYSTTFAGAFIGLIYGFIHAFIMGVVFAAIYNAVDQKDKQ